MKTTIFGLFLLSFSSFISAETYEGKVTSASGTVWKTQNLPCYIYSNFITEDKADIVLQFGIHPEIYTQHMILNKDDVYIGEKIAGYDLGLDTEKYLGKGRYEKTHTILKINDKQDKIKINKLFRIENQLIFNDEPHYNVTCEVELK